MAAKFVLASTIGALVALVPAAALAQATPKPGTSATSSAAKPPSRTALTGTWTGQVTEIGRAASFAMTLSVDAKGAGTTDYPDQGCAGKLTRVGTSPNYVFYSEVITRNAYDKVKRTGCLDGTLVLTRSGNMVLMSWFGATGDEAYHASATLVPATPKL